MSRVFVATFSAVAITAAQDLFELVAPSNSRVRLREIRVGQYSDAGDAAAELLSLTVIRGFTTSGSGGSAFTPLKPSAHTGAAAAGSTVEINNTTVAQDGTGSVMLADAWNVQAPWLWQSPDSARDPNNIWVEPSARIVVRITAPADSLTTNGTLIFEEVGMSYP